MRNILLIPVFLLLACREKNINPSAEQVPEPDKVQGDQGIRCEALPPPPAVFGWNDSVTDPEKHLLSFTYDPVNSNRVICMTKGDLTGYNKMFSFDLITKERIHLGFLGDYLPDINRNGWIAFNTIENDIYIIKTNGDSLRQITSNKLCQDPRWDHTGKSIFYYQMAGLNSGPAIHKKHIFGSPAAFLLSASQPYHVPFKNSNRIVYLQSNTNSIGMVLRDMATHEETALISGIYDPQLSHPFSNLCIDNNDENLYWSNEKGIFRYSLGTAKIDTILRNCPNYTFRNPMISLRGNDLTVAMHIRKPVGPYVLLHTFQAREMNLYTMQLSEVKLFDQ